MGKGGDAPTIGVLFIFLLEQCGASSSVLVCSTTAASRPARWSSHRSASKAPPAPRQINQDRRQRGVKACELAAHGDATMMILSTASTRSTMYLAHAAA